MSKYTKREQEKAIEQLRAELKPGDTVHTVLRHVSRSGMQRRIDVVLLRDGDTRYLTWLVAKALGLRSTGNGDGVVVGGCGMDMGFHIVYELGSVLWPKGADYVSGRNGSKASEPCGGYCLKQRWI